MSNSEELRPWRFEPDALSEEDPQQNQTSQQVSTATSQLLCAKLASSNSFSLRVIERILLYMILMMIIIASILRKNNYRFFSNDNINNFNI